MGLSGVTIGGITYLYGDNEEHKRKFWMAALKNLLKLKYVSKKSFDMWWNFTMTKMKSLILILFLIPALCKGQKDTTKPTWNTLTPIGFGTTNGLTYSNSIDRTYMGFSWNEKKPLYDTIIVRPGPGIITFYGETNDYDPYCPPGQTYFHSIRSGDVYIMADKCLPDSTVAEMWQEYFRNLSPRDTTTQNYYTTYRILTIGLGSFVTELYQVKTSTGWVEISKCRWYWENKSRLKCWGGYNNTVEVPCCTHFHRTKPL